MEYTPNANLKKPGYSDTVDIKDINDNFDAVDEHIGADIGDMTGAHGMRYNETDSVFEVLDAGTNQWTAIKCGKSPYEYAVEGGYSGTEAEFKALMAAAASTKYVDDAISEATKKLITLRIRPDSGSVGQEINIACSRLTGAMYAVEYSGAFTTNGNGKAEIIVSPPYGYAINMLNDSESLLIEYYDSSWHSRPEVQCTAKDDGSVFFSISGLQAYETCNFSFVRMDRTKIPYITMEVA